SAVPAFDELQAQLREEIARAKASDSFAEVRAQLADAAYAADDLEGPDGELGPEVREVAGVARPGGAGPVDHAGLGRQIASEDVLDGGYNAELMDVGDTVSVVARVRRYHEPRHLELADVRDEIEATLQTIATREALQAKADDLVAEIESGVQL